MHFRSYYNRRRQKTATRKGEINNEYNCSKVSLKERLRKYFEENAETITAGLLFMSGSASAYNLYRSMR